ncbi:MAG TPA: YceI family protein [Magnetospirillaceae bacterium]|nr:YceI family protein [Magnetospirillaceae bacterium]
MTGVVRYNAVAMIIHWLTALTVIGLLVVGNIMADLPKEQNALKFVLFQWHKTFGITILLLTLFRLAWRLTHKPPVLPEEMPGWEKRVAHVTHWLFYLLLVVVPLLGWSIVSSSPRNIPTFLFGVIPWPHIPMLADLEIDQKKAIVDVFENLHATAAYIMAGLIVLHIGAALRHRVLLKDKVVQRMLPRVIPVVLVAFGVAWAHPAAADWAVDAGKSTLGFNASVSGASFEGKFKSWQAEIAFDPASPAAGHAKVTIDMASAATGDRQRDSALPDSDWFAVKKNPQAVFEATSFKALGGNQYEAIGTLTIRGNSKPVTMPFTLDITGADAHAKGKLDIVRTDYGVGQGEWSTAETVGLGVSITFDLVAKKT